MPKNTKKSMDLPKNILLGVLAVVVLGVLAVHLVEERDQNEQYDRIVATEIDKINEAINDLEENYGDAIGTITPELLDVIDELEEAQEQIDELTPEEEPVFPWSDRYVFAETELICNHVYQVFEKDERDGMALLSESFDNEEMMDELFHEEIDLETRALMIERLKEQDGYGLGLIAVCHDLDRTFFAFQGSASEISMVEWNNETDQASLRPIDLTDVRIMDSVFNLRSDGSEIFLHTGYGDAGVVTWDFRIIHSDEYVPELVEACGHNGFANGGEGEMNCTIEYNPES